MEDVGLDMWMILVAAALLLVGAGLFLARQDDVAGWNTDRRSGDRRGMARRDGDERRGDLRLEHDDRVNNPDRRRSERREGERRLASDWKEHLEEVRGRVEDIQHDNRNF